MSFRTLFQRKGMVRKLVKRRSIRGKEEAKGERKEKETEDEE